MTKEELKQSRQNLGLNRKQMAYALKTPYTTYTKWERGERSLNSASTTAIRMLGFLHDNDMLLEWTNLNNLLEEK